MLGLEEQAMSVLIAKRPKTRKVVSGDGKAHPGRRMTAAEFANWCDDKTRAEWVEGDVILLSPDDGEHDEIHYSLKHALGVFGVKLKRGILRGDSFLVH